MRGTLVSGMTYRAGEISAAVFRRGKAFPAQLPDAPGIDHVRALGVDAVVVPVDHYARVIQEPDFGLAAFANWPCKHGRLAHCSLE